MNVIKHDHHTHGEQHNNSDQKNSIPYWKRAHRNILFWIMLLLTLAAMAFYVTSDNFALMFRSHAETPVSTTTGN